jgi:hypothetical protein
MAKFFLEHNESRRVVHDGESEPRAQILDAKRKLERIKNNKTSHGSADRNSLKNLLFEVAAILKRSNLSTNCKVASWLLLADVYGALSAQWAPTSISHAEHSFNEAIKCLESIHQMFIDLEEEPRLDIEFIKRCNTFNVADADSAIEILRNELLPDLKSMSENHPLIRLK